MKRNIILYLIFISFLFGKIPNELTVMPVIDTEEKESWFLSLDKIFLAVLPYVYSKDKDKYFLITENKNQTQKFYKNCEEIEKLLQNISLAHKNIKTTGKEKTNKLLFTSGKSLYKKFTKFSSSLITKINLTLESDELNIYKEFIILKKYKGNVDIFKTKLTILKKNIESIDRLISHFRSVNYQYPANKENQNKTLEILQIDANNNKKKIEAEDKKTEPVLEKIILDDNMRYDNIINIYIDTLSKLSFIDTLEKIDKDIEKKDIEKKHSEKDELIEYGVEFYNKGYFEKIRRIMAVLKGMDRFTHQVFNKNHSDWNRVIKAIENFSKNISIGDLIEINSDESLDRKKVLLHDKTIYLLMFKKFSIIPLSIIQEYFPTLLNNYIRNDEMKIEDISKELKKGDDRLEKEGIKNIEEILSIKPSEKIIFPSELVSNEKRKLTNEILSNYRNNEVIRRPKKLSKGREQGKKRENFNYNNMENMENIRRIGALFLDIKEK